MTGFYCVSFAGKEICQNRGIVWELAGGEQQAVMSENKLWKPWIFQGGAGQFFLMMPPPSSPEWGLYLLNCISFCLGLKRFFKTMSLFFGNFIQHFWQIKAWIASVTVITLLRWLSGGGWASSIVWVLFCASTLPPTWATGNAACFCSVCALQEESGEALESRAGLCLPPHCKLAKAGARVYF